MTRTHELLLTGDAQTWDRLGWRYTEGSPNVVLLHPDSQHSEQSYPMSLEQVGACAEYFRQVHAMMLDARRADQ